jgi:hypothetical protein
MATTTLKPRQLGQVEIFWPICAVLVALVQVAGFSTSIVMGRSSFAVPLYVHVHAFLFFGWVWLFVAQSFVAGRGSMRLHRRLGWLAVGWIPAMVVMGVVITVEGVRHSRVPFFFQPLYFLVMDPITVLTFAGLAGAAIVMRRRTQWHRRLMLCGMAVLTATGFGRLMPMPLLIPWAGPAALGATLVFPLAGMIRDYRHEGRVHPAWWWGITALINGQILTYAIVYSPIGQPLYNLATSGSPGASVVSMAYPPAPPR